MNPALALYLSAGEPSGDAHGAALVGALRNAAPAVILEAMGGPAMAAGARILERADSMAAFGLAEAARSLPAHLFALSRVGRRLRSRTYAAAALIDYPGFHLRVARLAAQHRIPVLYYIPPQLWAWAPGRARTLRESVSLVASVLPFEVPVLNRLGVRATFVGHPVLERTRPSPVEARRRLGIDQNRPVLALLPGSRQSEIRRHWPLFQEAARLLRARRPELALVLGTAPDQVYHLGDEPLVTTDAPHALAAATVALCKSGTATLEAAVAGVPMVIAYRLHPLTFAIARRLVRVPFIGLPNLIAGRSVAPEYLQGGATAKDLALAVDRLLDPASPTARRQREDLAEVVERLGPPGASARVAALLLELVA
ncbi:MAG TPA: lipid-A-disaccharide synthase [Gemmatimonadales bacterium]